MANGGINIQIKGAKELVKKFAQFSDEIKVEIQKELIATGLTELETKAKESLTDKGHVDTGRLRSSVTLKYKGKEKHSYADNEGNGYVCNLNSPVKDLKVSFGTDVPYAQKIERLDSFIYNNFEASKSEFKKNIDNVLKELTSKYS
jgi:hypothetical protein